VARYYRKAMPKPSHLEYSALAPGDRHRVDVLASLLRIATDSTSDTSAR